MRPATICLVLLAVFSPSSTLLADTFGTGDNQFTIDFVTIGNPGNAPDTTGRPNPAGSVGYAYNMGKYEVSRDMVIKANVEGNLGINLADMTLFGGNGADRPATGISWNQAARFVNWLNTSQGFPPAYKFALQPGELGYSVQADIALWQATDPGFNPANPFRNSQARYFLPSSDEWYKAAYYDPSANGGAGGYWNFPNGSDTAPAAVSGGTAAGTAVYKRSLGHGPADINSAGDLSPYGIMGLGGNVGEWEETTFDLLNNSPRSARGNRGGSWPDEFSALLSASERSRFVPAIDSLNGGFRVASIPEPSTGLLGALGMLALVRRRRRSR